MGYFFLANNNSNEWCHCTRDLLLKAANMRESENKSCSEKESCFSCNKSANVPKRDSSQSSIGARRVSISYTDCKRKETISTNTSHHRKTSKKSKCCTKRKKVGTSDSCIRRDSRSSVSSTASERSIRNTPSSSKKCSLFSKCSKSASPKSVKLPSASSTYKNSMLESRQFGSASLTNLYIGGPEKSIGDSQMRNKSRGHEQSRRCCSRKSSDLTLADVRGPLTLNPSSLNQLANKKLIQAQNDSKKPGGEKPRICWALAKINLYKRGVREFEILEVSPHPPGQYLVINKNTLMLLKKGKK